MTGKEIWGTLKDYTPIILESPANLYDVLNSELKILINDKDLMIDLYMRGEIAMWEEIAEWEDLNDSYIEAIQIGYQYLKEYSWFYYPEETYGTYDWPDLTPGGT